MRSTGGAAEVRTLLRPFTRRLGQAPQGFAFLPDNVRLLSPSEDHAPGSSGVLGPTGAGPLLRGDVAPLEEVHARHQRARWPGRPAGLRETQSMPLPMRIGARCSGATARARQGRRWHRPWARSWTRRKAKTATSAASEHGHVPRPVMTETTMARAAGRAGEQRSASGVMARTSPTLMSRPRWRCPIQVPSTP